MTDNPIARRFAKIDHRLAQLEHANNGLVAELRRTNGMLAVATDRLGAAISVIAEHLELDDLTGRAEQWLANAIAEQQAEADAVDAGKIDLDAANAMLADLEAIQANDDNGEPA